MFEHMEIVESIYELVLETSYKNPTSAYSTRADHNRLKKGGVALSNTYSKISDSAGKRRNKYVD